MKKRILFISPEAFGYYKKIIHFMEQREYEVDWLHQIPSETVYTKAFVRLFPRMGEVYSNRYFRAQINWDKSYDYVLVIKGEGLSSDVLAELRAKQNKAEFIFYNWDSFNNSQSALKKLQYFDRLYSFDSEDCKQIDNVNLLPLFHDVDLDKANLEIAEENKYSSFFAGTIHSNRYVIVNEIVKEIKKTLNKPDYSYYYYPSLIAFYVKKIVDKQFRVIPQKKLGLEKLSPDFLLEKMAQSTVVIDICNTHQNGLTMRTIEAVGMRRKIITNNKRIKEYNFYCPDNILTFSELTPETLKTFLMLPYKELPEAIYKRLHLESWLSVLFDND